MDGDGLLEPYLSFSSEAFCNGRPFGYRGGRSRIIARPDVKWRDGLGESLGAKTVRFRDTQRIY